MWLIGKNIFIPQKKTNAILRAELGHQGPPSATARAVRTAGLQGGSTAVHSTRQLTKHM